MGGLATADSVRTPTANRSKGTRWSRLLAQLTFSNLLTFFASFAVACIAAVALAPVAGLAVAIVGFFAGGLIEGMVFYNDIPLAAKVLKQGPSHHLATHLILRELMIAALTGNGTREQCKADIEDYFDGELRDQRKLQTLQQTETQHKKKIIQYLDWLKSKNQQNLQLPKDLEQIDSIYQRLASEIKTKSKITAVALVLSIASGIASVGINLSYTLAALLSIGTPYGWALALAALITTFAALGLSLVYYKAAHYAIFHNIFRKIANYFKPEQAWGDMDHNERIEFGVVTFFKAMLFSFIVVITLLFTFATLGAWQNASFDLWRSIMPIAGKLAFIPEIISDLLTTFYGLLSLLFAFEHSWETVKLLTEKTFTLLWKGLKGLGLGLVALFSHPMQAGRSIKQFFNRALFRFRHNKHKWRSVGRIALWIGTLGFLLAAVALHIISEGMVAAQGSRNKRGFISRGLSSLANLTITAIAPLLGVKAHSVSSFISTLSESTTHVDYVIERTHKFTDHCVPMTPIYSNSATSNERAGTDSTATTASNTPNSSAPVSASPSFEDLPQQPSPAYELPSSLSDTHAADPRRKEGFNSTLG